MSVLMKDFIQIMYGDKADKIKSLVSEYPLTARTVCMLNSDYLMDLFAGTEITVDEIEAGIDEENGTKKVKKTSKKTDVEADIVEDEEEAEEEQSNEYENMTAKELYKLCCERGISSQCKSRSKANLIKVLKAFDNGEFGQKEQEQEQKEETKKTTKGRKSKKEKEEPKKEEISEDETEDWNDDLEEKEEKSNPYDGKKPQQLYKECIDRGIKVPKGKKEDFYIDKLVEDDKKKTEDDSDEDWDDDDWSID